MTVHKSCEKHLLDKDLVARDGKTYCNFFVQRVCRDLGYKKFAGKLANQIYSMVLRSKEWAEVTPEDAHLAAVNGFLVVAAMQGNPHGHVAIVYPGIMVFSGKWRRYVPQVASVGKRNGIFGCNWAFRDMPRFFKWI